ncbi:hypothetical protein B0H14DRAFT_2782167, partial [Mycena olivaceomarginata]
RNKTKQKKKKKKKAPRRTHASETLLWHKICHGPHAGCRYCATCRSCGSPICMELPSSSSVSSAALRRRSRRAPHSIACVIILSAWEAVRALACDVAVATDDIKGFLLGGKSARGDRPMCRWVESAENIQKTRSTPSGASASPLRIPQPDFSVSSFSSRCYIVSEMHARCVAGNRPG